MQTETLFYTDANLFSFTARVLRCEAEGERWTVTLDRTAFFPEMGGQSADTGALGSVRVTDAHMREGVVVHYTDGPLTPGEEVTGVLDAPERLRKMQTHTAEHILSGLAHAHWGYENVGFHLAEDGCTMDLSGELSPEDTARLEREANEIVRRNLAVRTWFPDAEELARTEYRSKGELEGAVRLVAIGDVDVCACCAPHVDWTGCIGCVKITAAMRHRGGMRLWVKAGADAVALFAARFDDAAAISAMLSAPADALPEAVRALLEERRALKAALAAERQRALLARVEALSPTGGSRCLFLSEDASADELRAAANALREKTGGLSAVFAGTEGSYRFALTGHGDVNAAFAAVRETMAARGGGRDGLVMGSCAADRAALENLFRAE